MLTAIGTHTGSPVFSFGVVLISIYHRDVSYASCILVLCVVIITTLSKYYCNFICGVQQAWATGEIWRNLGELDASYVAVICYQLMPMLMFMT